MCSAYLYLLQSRPVAQETVMNDGDVDANDNICLQVIGSNSGGPDN